MRPGRTNTSVRPLPTSGDDSDGPPSPPITPICAKAGDAALTTSAGNAAQATVASARPARAKPFRLVKEPPGTHPHGPPKEPRRHSTCGCQRMPSREFAYVIKSFPPLKRDNERGRCDQI